MMLRLNPHLVGDLKKLQTVESGHNLEPAARAWITKDRTVPGHIGSPQFATAEKGEALFQTFTNDVVQLLERVVSWDGKSWR
jgi:creatinine amidohydrolase